MIATGIYLLCTLTCAGAALLLWRGFRRSRQRLLYWSALCFAIMGIANAILVVDKVVVPDIDLMALRSIVNQIAYLVLIIGLIFESD